MASVVSSGRGHFFSGTKSSSVNWERPFRAAAPTIMAKTGELERDSELASSHCNVQIQIAGNAHDVTAILITQRHAMMSSYII